MELMVAAGNWGGGLLKKYLCALLSVEHKGRGVHYGVYRY